MLTLSFFVTIAMALLANFRGYYPGYSGVFARDLSALTWVVLKGHTGNRAGRVTLRSSNPLDTPAINFNYFADGDGDLKAVVDGIRFVRRISRKLREQGVIAREEVPGIEVAEDRKLFAAMLRKLNIPQPPNGIATSEAEALAVALVGRPGTLPSRQSPTCGVCEQ
jgi:hypothetical protein